MILAADSSLVTLRSDKKDNCIAFPTQTRPIKDSLISSNKLKSRRQHIFVCHMYANLTISRTLRFPKEKAMALGGVATGSMKAREAAIVQGSIT